MAVGGVGGRLSLHGRLTGKPTFPEPVLSPDGFDIQVRYLASQELKSLRTVPFERHLPDLNQLEIVPVLLEFEISYYCDELVP